MFNEEKIYLIQPDHVSPGEMTVQVPQAFSTTHEYFDDININAVESFNGISDYIGETISQCPTVLNTLGRFICLDGWNLIEEARQAQLETIRCLVQVADNCPDEEIAIRKVATRIIPANGKCSYLETVRNVKALYQMLMATRENLVCFHHGGRRRGNEFINNKEENVRLILATRLGKSPNTISKYLNHGEHLSDYAMPTLMATIPDQTVKPNKQFFEKAQSNKNKMQVDLKSEGKPENEITEKLSGYVLQMFDEYKRTGDIQNYTRSQAADSEDNHAEKLPVEDAPSDSIAIKFLPKDFSYYPGNQASPEQTSFSINDIKADIATIATNLCDLSQNQNAQLPEVTLYVTASISALSQCLQKCRTIDLTIQQHEGGNAIWVN